jgi:Profilin
MSAWKSYLDESLLGAGLASGAILSRSGDALASSPDFHVKPDTARKLLAVLDSTGSAARDVFTNGFIVGGSKYTLNRAETDDESDLKFLIGRCKVRGEPVRGIIIVPTLTAIIFAVHDPLHSPDLSFGRANIAVTVLAETLVLHNY